MLRGPHCPAGWHEHVAARHAPSATCEWHAENGRLRLPAEVAAHGSKRHEALAANGALAIASPAHGARLRIDALLPRSRQALRLSALVREPAVRRVRWEIDRRRVAEVAAPYSAFWTIEPGRHQVAAVALAADGREIARQQALIDVDGGTR
jgi:hypothetical protein